mmetsp:Transcript_106624/g.302006  ORF Transcript_106624/g.302006 Transcript_106624/m.302006 type:complete len:473 (-) Transcript_106624:335-1753(-)
MKAWCGYLTFFASLTLGRGLGELPSFRAATKEAAQDAANMMGAKWWTQVGRHVYTAPTEDNGLSDRVEDYYCAMGSDDALTDSMREKRVGGEGRWHIFHLPQGPSSLGITSKGGRRSAFSSLVQLRSGAVLNIMFPAYTPQQPCASASGRLGGMEAAAVARLTAGSFMSTLQEVVALGNSDGVVTRSYQDSSGQDAAQKYIQKQFKAAGIPTCLQKFGSNTQLAQNNVLGVIPGASGEKGTITLGAHYDSRPFTGAAPGAEDNGSGLAALISIAKAYAASGIKPQKTIYFVGFAAEEPGCLGSDWFAKQLKAGKTVPELCHAEDTGARSFLQVHRGPEDQGNFTAQGPGGDDHHAAIALDEVGWLSPKYSKGTVNLESYDWSSPILDKLACSSIQHNGDSLDLVHSNSPFGSDHMSFLMRGIQSALVINGDDDGYPNYHKSTDTIENVTPEYANKISKMVMGALVQLAGTRE